MFTDKLKLTTSISLKSQIFLTALHDSGDALCFALI